MYDIFTRPCGTAVNVEFIYFDNIFGIEMFYLLPTNLHMTKKNSALIRENSIMNA